MMAGVLFTVIVFKWHASIVFLLSYKNTVANLQLIYIYLGVVLFHYLKII